MQPQEGDKVWNFDPWADRHDAIVAHDAQHYYARYADILRLDELREACARHDISLQSRQLTSVTWVLWAVKGGV